MKTFLSKTCALVAMAATLLSFSVSPALDPPAGGEGFEIFLNGKLIRQRFGKEINTVKTLQLSQASPNDKLTIRYHHCGQVGKNRVITVKVNR